MYTRIMEVDPWVIKSTTLDKTHKRLQESLTSLGNGYMGARGSFEERYSATAIWALISLACGFPIKPASVGGKTAIRNISAKPSMP